MLKLVNKKEEELISLAQKIILMVEWFNKNENEMSEEECEYHKNITMFLIEEYKNLTGI